MIGGKLLLITNRKSYMSFRFVPKSVTLNDLERRNGPYFALSPNSVASGAHCVKVVEDVVVKKFTFALSSSDEFLVFLGRVASLAMDAVYCYRSTAVCRCVCRS